MDSEISGNNESRHSRGRIHHCIGATVMISRKTPRAVVALILALAFVFFFGGYVAFKAVKHEQAQSMQIASLQAQLSLLEANVEGIAGGEWAARFTGRVTEDEGGGGFDYLAIGNSITLHGLADYWWGEWGMAASKLEYDYYHGVVDGLEKRKGSVNTAAYNYSVWETQSHDRAETWEFLDGYLVPGINLVTIQLSENCSDVSTFESDFQALLKHINTAVPEAVVVVIDDFWDEGRSQMKKKVCYELGIPFVDLSDIRGDEKYMAGMGAVVMGDDGAEHVIEHEGVARHPGDEAMEVIADRVLDQIE